MLRNATVLEFKAIDEENKTERTYSLYIDPTSPIQEVLYMLDHMKKFCEERKELAEKAAAEESAKSVAEEVVA